MPPKARIVPQSITIESTLVISNLEQIPPGKATLQCTKVRKEWWDHVDEVRPSIKLMSSMVLEGNKRTRAGPH